MNYTRDTAIRSAATTGTRTTKSNRKTYYSTLEKPLQIVIKPQLEQIPKKIETYLLTTGGKVEKIGLACVVLDLIGAVFAFRIRTKAQS